MLLEALHLHCLMQSQLPIVPMFEVQHWLPWHCVRAVYRLVGVTVTFGLPVCLADVANEPVL